jgi:hypothetical protein
MVWVLGVTAQGRGVISVNWPMCSHTTDTIQPTPFNHIACLPHPHLLVATTWVTDGTSVQGVTAQEAGMRQATLMGEDDPPRTSHVNCHPPPAAPPIVDNSA